MVAAPRPVGKIRYTTIPSLLLQSKVADSLQGFAPMPPRDHLNFLDLDFSFDDQLKAVAKMLRLYEDESYRRDASLKSLQAEHRQSTIGPQRQFVGERMAKLFNEAIFEDATNSMGALGMLAPFIETIFYQGFQAIGAKLYSQAVPLSHARWQSAQTVQWDCHFVFENGKIKRDLAKGIVQISDAVGLLPKLPSDLKPRIEALFLYRNKMFHHGLEWPQKERKVFERQIQIWPTEWFLRAFRNEEVWIFYLSYSFIADAVAMIQKILDGMGSFVLERQAAIGGGGYLATH